MSTFTRHALVLGFGLALLPACVHLGTPDSGGTTGGTTGDPNADLDQYNQESAQLDMRRSMFLGTNVQDTLKLNEDQKKQLADLQKEIDAKLTKILTEDQNKQLNDMKTNTGRGPGGAGGAGGPGGTRRPGGGNPPPPQQ